MRIKDQLLAIQAALNDWATSESGTASIAGDKSQLVQLLSMGPGKPRAVIVYIGEKPRGEEDSAEMSRVDRVFWAIISRGQGFKVTPGASLVEGAGGGKPMFELVEGARDVIRTLMLDPETTERPIYFQGIDPFDMGADFRVDAYTIAFAIGTDIGQISDDPNA